MTGQETNGDQSIEARHGRSPILYTDLDAPEPADPTPPAAARWIAFSSILIAGLLGGLIGYGTGTLMSESPIAAAGGALLGAAACAVGVGIVAGLALRAMNEWKPVSHPEAETETRAASGLVMRSTIADAHQADRATTAGDDDASGERQPGEEPTS